MRRFLISLTLLRKVFKAYLLIIITKVINNVLIALIGFKSNDKSHLKNLFPYLNVCIPTKYIASYNISRNSITSVAPFLKNCTITHNNPFSVHYITNIKKTQVYMLVDIFWTRKTL